MSGDAAAFEPQRGVTSLLAARRTALIAEHGVLMRQLGGLQHRVDQLQREHANETGALQGELLRLRAQIVVSRTEVYWGLTTRPHLRVAARLDTRVLPRGGPGRAVPPAEELAAAQGVLCQTGCMGHAHPWRDAEGQCRLTGQVCEPSTAGVAESAETDAPPHR